MASWDERRSGESGGNTVVPSSGLRSERELLDACLDVAEDMIAAGRDAEACAYLAERVLPLIADRARAAL